MDIEAIAKELALSLPNAVDLGTTGRRASSQWPKDFSPHEQAIFRLVAERIVNLQPPNVRG